MMQRYEIFPNGCDDGQWLDEEESEDGEWVRYEDAKKYEQALKEIAQKVKRNNVTSHFYINKILKQVGINGAAR